MILSRQPLLILVLSFILGIFFQDYFSLDQNSVYLILFFVFLLFGLIFLKNLFLFKLRNAFLISLFFGLGISFHFYNNLNNENLNLKTNETLVFKVSKKLNSNERYKKYEVVAEVENQSFNAIVSVEKDK